MKMLRYILNILIASIFLSTAAFAQEDEIEKLREEANALIQKGEIDAALSLYFSLIKGANSFARQEKQSGAYGIVAIYRDHKNDDKKAFVWCIVGSHYAKNLFESCLYELSQTRSKEEVNSVRDLAYQCIVSKFEECSELNSRWNEKVAQFSSTKCRVKSESIGKLKYQILPNGRSIKDTDDKIIAETEPFVTILDEMKDPRGQQWAFIRADNPNWTLGWVLKKTLQCGL